MKKSNRRKSNPALAVDYDDSDSDYEDFAPPQKKRASSHKKREKISPTWKEEEEIEGFTISTLDSPNGSDSKEIHNKHPRENEEEASEGIAALLGLASEDVIHKKPHKNIFTDPAYSSSESEAKSKESRKHRKALVPVTYTYASSDEDYNSEVYEIEEEEEDIEEDLVLENDEAEYQPYSQRTMKKKEKEKVRTPKRSSIKPKRTIKKRTHYPDDSESSEFSSPPPPSSSSISSSSTTNTTRTVPINPPPPIPTHLPGTVPVVDNNVASILNNDLSKPMIKTSPMSPSSSKKSSSFPTILPGSHNLSNSRSGWRRGATHVAIAQYIYNQQRQDPKQQPLIHSNGFNGNTHYGNGNHSMNGGTPKMSGIDPTLESKIFKEHASNYSKSPTLHHQQQQHSRNTSSPVSNRQMPMSNYPPPKFPPPPPPFSPNTKHFTNSFPGNPFPPPFQNSNGSPFPFPPPPSGYPGPQFQQFPPFPGNSPNYFQPYNSPLPQQHQSQASSDSKTTIKMIPYSVHHIHHKRPRNKKDPIAASTSNLQLPPPLAPPPLQSRDFTLRPLNLNR